MSRAISCFDGVFELGVPLSPNFAFPLLVRIAGGHPYHLYRRGQARGGIRCRRRNNECDDDVRMSRVKLPAPAKARHRCACAVTV